MLSDVPNWQLTVDSQGRSSGHPPISSKPHPGSFAMMSVVKKPRHSSQVRNNDQESSGNFDQEFKEK
jgi:hypothetical protein